LVTIFHRIAGQTKGALQECDSVPGFNLGRNRLCLDFNQRFAARTSITGAVEMRHNLLKPQVARAQLTDCRYFTTHIRFFD
jgi:hypothetical protein